MHHEANQEQQIQLYNSSVKIQVTYSVTNGNISGFEVFTLQQHTLKHDQSARVRLVQYISGKSVNVSQLVHCTLVRGHGNFFTHQFSSQPHQIFEKHIFYAVGKQETRKLGCRNENV